MPIRFTRRFDLPEEVPPLYELVSYFTDRKKLKRSPKVKKKVITRKDLNFRRRPTTFQVMKAVVLRFGTFDRPAYPVESI